MISTICARSGGPPAALITLAGSRKYCEPIAAGVITRTPSRPDFRGYQTAEQRIAPAAVRRPSVGAEPVMVTSVAIICPRPGTYSSATQILPSFTRTGKTVSAVRFLLTFPKSLSRTSLTTPSG